MRDADVDMKGLKNECNSSLFFAGYYVYMRERRDQLRSMYPEMPFYEIIRQLAQEWNNMDREVKQVRWMKM